MLYSLDEICLVPGRTSKVSSRSECEIYKSDKLPLYVAPMASLIDAKNIDDFETCGFNTILPRTLDLELRMEMLSQGYTVAFGLKEAEHIFNRLGVLKVNNQLNYKPHICIDQANGHMDDLLNLCRRFKELLGRHGVWIMTGNIANPGAYYEYAKVGIDAVRIGIGTGSACTTSIQTGIHYPMGSLIVNCCHAKFEVEEQINIDYGDSYKPWAVADSLNDMNSDISEYKSVPKIIADGGFKTIDQIIKALALGADYVMLGEIIAQSKEACGETKWTLLDGVHCDARLYYGMSTAKAQEDINNTSSIQNDIKHSEGICKWVPVKYSINDWKESFEHGLKSAMSYTGASNLDEFISHVQWDTMSPSTIFEYKQNKKVYTWD